MHTIGLRVLLATAMALLAVGSRARHEVHPRRARGDPAAAPDAATLNDALASG